MKNILLALSLAAVGVSTATAQVYQPNVVNGSLLGGIAGAIIGGHNHDRWGEGAIIGAAAGALIGSAVEAPRPVVYQPVPVSVAQTVPTAPMVPAAPVVAYPSAPVMTATAAPQVVYVQQAQPTQVVYVPYYANPPVYYSAPIVRVGVGYHWGPSRGVHVSRGHRHW
jgi:hypothetical protein